MKGAPMIDMLETFFYGNRSHRADAPASPTLRSCFDQSMTPLQWIVHEMPKLAAKHRPFLFVAHPGQVVWVPDDWLHMTLNIDDCLYVYKGSCTSASEQARRRTDSASAREFVLSIRRVCRETGRFCDGYCHAPPVCEWCGDGHRVKCSALAGAGRSVEDEETGKDGVGEVGVGEGGTREAIEAQRRSIRERKRKRRRKEERRRKRRRVKKKKKS